METGGNNSLTQFTEAFLSLNKPVFLAEAGSDFLYLLAIEKNTSKKAFCALHQVSVLDELTRIASQKEIKASIGKFYISTCNLKHTLIPTAIFEKEQSYNYLKLNCNVSANDLVQYKNMDVFDAVSVYALEKNLAQIATAVYPGVELLSSAFVFASNGINNISDSFSLYFYKNIFFVRYVKNHKMVFFNGFVYNSVSDAIYYILYCFDQLKLNCETEKIEIAGIESVLAQLSPEIKKYIKNIANTNKKEHHYLNLYNIEKCV